MSKRKHFIGGDLRIKIHGMDAGVCDLAAAKIKAAARGAGRRTYGPTASKELGNYSMKREDGSGQAFRASLHVRELKVYGVDERLFEELTQLQVPSSTRLTVQSENHIKCR